jgi:hypothetical protein
VAFGAANTAKGVPQRAKEATAVKKGFARRREKRDIGMMFKINWASSADCDPTGGSQFKT